MAGGGSGGYNSNYVTVVPGASYTITVGSGGSSYAYKNSVSANAGNSGFVLIAYGGDI